MTRTVNTAGNAETIQNGIAEVNGAQLYYELAGSGDPLVLIHGNGGDCRHWDDQFEFFAETCQVIRYDARGFGKSSLPLQGDAYSHHSDLAALLRHLGVTGAHIVGLSMGCGIAVDFVLAHAEMSKSLVAVGPWVFGYESAACEELWEVNREIARIVRDQGIQSAADYWFGPAHSEAMRHPAVVQRMTRIGYDYSFWPFIHEDPWRSLDPPAVENLHRIGVPTLIVTAEYDIEACREIADLLEQKVAGSQKIDIRGSGHVMNMEKPEEFNRTVLEFLDGVPAEQDDNREN